MKNLAKEKIKIDNYETQTKFTDYEWVDKSYSSVSEMAGNLLLKSSLLVSKEAVNLVFMGVVSDSNHFLYKQTTARTFKIASFLQEKGADLDLVYSNLYKSLPSF